MVPLRKVPPSAIQKTVVRRWGRCWRQEASVSIPDVVVFIQLMRSLVSPVLCFRLSVFTILGCLRQRRRSKLLVMVLRVDEGRRGEAICYLGPGAGWRAQKQS